MKNNFVLVFLFYISIQNANCLKCYTCISTSPNVTCFAPVNKTKIPTLTCNKSTSIFEDVVNVTHLNPAYVKEALSASEYECVSYKRHYQRGNVTEVGRGCFPKRSNVDPCQTLYIVGNTEHQLQECDVCKKDNCNSSSSILSLSKFVLLGILFIRIYAK